MFLQKYRSFSWKRLLFLVFFLFLFFSMYNDQSWKRQSLSMSNASTTCLVNEKKKITPMKEWRKSSICLSIFIIDICIHFLYHFQSLVNYIVCYLFIKTIGQFIFFNFIYNPLLFLLSSPYSKSVNCLFFQFSLLSVIF